MFFKKNKISDCIIDACMYNLSIFVNVRAVDHINKQRRKQ